MPQKNNQTLWVGISFLAVGLLIGMILSDGTLTSGGKDTQTVAGVDPAQLQTVSVSNDNDAVLGDPNAPVTIVEFSDFQCPYCESFFTETFGQLKKDYVDTGIVKIVFRDFPLPSHKNASLAAQAAECVRNAGGAVNDEVFFKMHDLLFAQQMNWGSSSDAKSIIENLAKGTLGVDISACLDSEEMKSEVEADYVAGRSYGVSGTPTFFINGKKLVGAWPYDTFKTVIEFVR